MLENKKEKNFKSGEGEGLVKDIRGHLRYANYYQQNGNTSKAREHKREAEKLIGALLGKLSGRFQNYAWTCMGTKSQDDIDDAIAEITRRVLGRVMDISGSAGALFFEQKFNKAILGCMDDAIDHARGEYLDWNTELLKERKQRKLDHPEDESGDEFNADMLPRSIDELDAEESEALEMAQADTESLKAVEALLTEEVYREFLEKQSPKNRRLIEGWWNQKSAKGLASELGITEKTVRNRLAVLLEELALQILGPQVVAQAYRKSQKQKEIQKKK